MTVPLRQRCVCDLIELATEVPYATAILVEVPRLTRILIVTDAWLPQINGVVRSIEALVREAPSLGVEIVVLASSGFRTVPVPTRPPNSCDRDATRRSATPHRGT